MKKQLLYFTIISFNCLFSLIEVVAQQETIEQSEANLKQYPANYDFYQKLHLIVANKNNATTFEEREKLQNIFEKYGRWSAATTYADNEKGDRITLKCHIKDQKGKPIANAKAHVFQTDAKGFYSVTDSATGKMGENDARLFAFVNSDANGNIEIKTVRPASYPKMYNGRHIPQHIHFNITADGYSGKFIQMVFEDDPAMKDIYWQKWAKENNFPVVKLTKGEGQFTLLMNK